MRIHINETYRQKIPEIPFSWSNYGRGNAWRRKASSEWMSVTVNLQNNVRLLKCTRM